MKSIRTKLVFWICVLFIFIGLIIYLSLSYVLPRKITAQILKRDVEIARYLSGETEDLLLLKDKIALSLLLHDNLDRLEDAQYLFIQDTDGSIISHTFGKSFPKGLMFFRPESRSAHKIREFLGNGNRIYDISVPILEGEMGALHLGVSLESGKKDVAEITRINHYVAIVILIGLGIGIVIFLIIGFLFSNQIIRLKNFAAKIGDGDLEAKIDIKSKDEIGVLAEAFNEMVQNLKEKVQQIKRLNTIEERNKIALDLHDGWAQDMANIIKRTELCERLFKIDPSKALKELSVLRENTKGMLNKMRGVIFELKSPEETQFDLTQKLTEYITNYRKQGHLDVKLDISGSLDNIAAGKSRSIFYIIVEALTNIEKHSRAKCAEVILKIHNDNNLIIDIKDDGKGFNVKKASQNIPGNGKLGLRSMRQRANSLSGKVDIKSKKGEGTKISIDIPLEDKN
ncbi:MAG: sensor histidine kinase [bacterium]